MMLRYAIEKFSREERAILMAVTERNLRIIE